MSLPPHRRTTTTIPSHLRAPSAGAPTSTSAQSTSAAQASTAHPALAARIADKRRELAHLTELRDLSAQLAGQMAALEAKLGTLASGTEAVATVLANWHSVLQAIQMASAKIPASASAADDEEGAADDAAGGVPLPQTLVRIPVQQAPMSDGADE